MYRPNPARIERAGPTMLNDLHQYLSTAKERPCEVRSRSSPVIYAVCSIRATDAIGGRA